MKTRRCALGLWDENIPEISFNAEGVSNFAQIQQKLIATYPRGSHGENEWEQIVKEVKKKRKSKYDCIVGVSGGVDSSYLLYLLKRKYGLNPLAVTLDNGWSTKIAVENIKKMTSELDVDLETYVIDYEEIKDLLRAYMLAGLPWIDMPTDLAIKSVMHKYALKESVKFIFRGNDFRSEGKQPRPWTYGDNTQLQYIHGKFGKLKKLKTYPQLNYSTIIYASFVKKIKEIRPFYYLDYDKKAARAFLEKEFGWQYYGGHHHENSFTKYAMAVWLPEKFNIDKRVINLSAQVMDKKITREEALEELESPALDNKTKRDLTKYISKKLDLTEEEFDNIWKSNNKDFTHYPNDLVYLKFAMKYLKPLIRLVYRQEPMTFVEINHNQNK